VSLAAHLLSLTRAQTLQAGDEVIVPEETPLPAALTAALALRGVRLSMVHYFARMLRLLPVAPDARAQVYMAADEHAERVANPAYAPLCVSHWIAEVFHCPTPAVFTPPVAQFFQAAAAATLPPQARTADVCSLALGV
jgi:hypothetical protein